MSRDLMIPMPLMPWGFFDRQRFLFNEMYRDMEEEFKMFDKELERVRSNLFQLEPFDTEPNFLPLENSIVSDTDGKNKKLALRFNVNKFKPEEIEVKVTDDKVLRVHAKHEEVTPEKKVFREFSRHYTLPKSVDPAQLKSFLAQDGVLHIEAPTPDAIEEPKKERLIPIEMK